ncbi:hypothetical protein CRE_17168 [Caenorhabditis remanei]|uniref:Uncharacterized protein n=1 Tax=Caenorhabditis remanei TaxID=31234 RepID=E3MAH6_CAERE|nr:hypothetical protein CRE_17168 [Caenorhabditis remanei]
MSRMLSIRENSLHHQLYRAIVCKECKDKAQNIPIVADKAYEKTVLTVELQIGGDDCENKGAPRCTQHKDAGWVHRPAVYICYDNSVVLCEECKSAISPDQLVFDIKCISNYYLETLGLFKNDLKESLKVLTEKLDLYKRALPSFDLKSWYHEWAQRQLRHLDTAGDYVTDPVEDVNSICIKTAASIMAVTGPLESRIQQMKGLLKDVKKALLMDVIELVARKEVFQSLNSRKSNIKTLYLPDVQGPLYKYFPLLDEQRRSIYLQYIRKIEIYDFSKESHISKGFTEWLETMEHTTKICDDLSVRLLEKTDGSWTIMMITDIVNITQFETEDGEGDEEECVIFSQNEKRRKNVQFLEKTDKYKIKWDQYDHPHEYIGENTISVEDRTEAYKKLMFYLNENYGSDLDYDGVLEKYTK